MLCAGACLSSNETYYVLYVVLQLTLSRLHGESNSTGRWDLGGTVTKIWTSNHSRALILSDVKHLSNGAQHTWRTASVLHAYVHAILLRTQRERNRIPGIPRVNSMKLKLERGL